MGDFKVPSRIPSRVPFPFFFFFFFFLTTILITPSLANNNNNSSSPAPANTNNNTNAYTNNYTPFKPSIAVIVGVLTTMFSITFILLLYAKHCKRENGGVGYANHAAGLIITPSTIRKNSGIDRGVIESLPIFRFGALRGQKDGLECAVCLTKFEPTEVLRLLPKCKHAFHVECVDTWLDGHSTCPLCRYRVDPEDVLLVEEAKISVEKTESSEPELILKPEFRRVSGRHSSAGEFGHSSSLIPTTSFRRSLDDGGASATAGCFDRPRKDGLLLSGGLTGGDDRKSFERRFGHQIILSAAPGCGGFHQRWSDVQPSDLLYLRSEMLISDRRRFSSGSSRPSLIREQAQQQQQMLQTGSDSGDGSGVINSRSVSDITGLRRESNNGFINRDRNEHRQRRVGLVSRWLAWISSRSQSPPAVRSDRTTNIGNVV